MTEEHISEFSYAFWQAAAIIYIDSSDTKIRPIKEGRAFYLSSDQF